MGEGEVIELSVEETNKLRAELGLAPLRGTRGNEVQDNAAKEVGESAMKSGETKEVLELSFDETNKLRAKLGLKPLKVNNSEKTGKSSREAVHKPASNEGDNKALKESIERARLERDVRKGIETKFEASTLADNAESNVLSWAAKMRKPAESESTKTVGKTKKKKKKSSKQNVTPINYDEDDLEGMQVSHAASDFEAGSTTILTFADAPLLERKANSTKVVGLNSASDKLQNAELASQQKQEEGLRKKRQLELGMGRAGGYAGFDDDEFEELGGSMGPSRLARGQQLGPSQDQESKKQRGFILDSGGKVKLSEDKNSSDLFAHQSGVAISLEASNTDVMATDFLTAEEDASKQKKKKKEAKFKKKKKKDKKKRRKLDDAEEEVDNGSALEKGPSLLDELEGTAVVQPKQKRKRRRRSDSDADEGEPPKVERAPGSFIEQTEDSTPAVAEDETARKREKYDSIMEKGNERTAAAFKTSVTKQDEEKTEKEQPVDEELDDEFLNAAVAKARRLRRLREMSKPSSTGADAVLEAVHSAAQIKPQEAASEETMEFAVDETREFTRAMRARTEQLERKKQRNPSTRKDSAAAKRDETKVETVKEEAMDVDDGQDLAELAKELKDDVEADFDGATSNAVTVGFGLSNALTLLRQTGELTGRNAGREELRGRAKDERTYDDYKPLDLSRVVRIGPNATDKDREFASREIKLDYRDEHGRLLTRKEAYRELCYQFHGHGSSKKKQEKRLQQIERERAEARLASRQLGAGSLGALKATQKATKKAFVVHKT